MNRRGSTKLPPDQDKEKGARLADYNGTQYTVVSSKNMSLGTVDSEPAMINLQELSRELQNVQNEEAIACQSDSTSSTPSSNVRTEVKVTIFSKLIDSDSRKQVIYYGLSHSNLLRNRVERPWNPGRNTSSFKSLERKLRSRINGKRPKSSVLRFYVLVSSKLAEHATGCG